MKKSFLPIALLVIWMPLFMGAWDKDKPAATTSLRQSNPEMLENQSSIEDAIDNEHIFATGGTQTGDHVQGSARTFSQATAPTTRIDTNVFISTDLGSLWTDTDDNAIYVLTATTPTWTPLSTEMIATLLGSPRVFTDTLGVTGDLAVNADKFTVDATTGNTLVAGTLNIASTIPITAMLDEDAMGSDSATAVASQQSIKAYVDNNVGSANWTPTSYAGEESVTFPNGLIMKTDTIARDGTSTAVVFDVAFSTLVSITFSQVHTSGTSTNPSLDSVSVNGFTIKSGSSPASFYWTAIGY